MGIGNKSKCVINLKGENNNHDKQENYNNLFFKNYINRIRRPEKKVSYDLTLIRSFLCLFTFISLAIAIIWHHY